MKARQLKEWSDRELIVEYQLSNSARCLEELYLRYHLKVKRYCFAILKDKETAGDMMQDTFIKVSSNLSKLKHVATFVGWLFQIARNLCLDHIKRQSKTKAARIEETLDLADEIIDLEDLEAKEFQISLMEVLIDELNEQDKKMLKLKYVDKISIKEIQAEFELSESAVKMRLARARKKVLRMYNKNGSKPV